MNFKILGTGLLIIAIITSFFLFSKKSFTNYPPKNEKIVAFGDSLIVGVGSTKGNDFISLLSKRIGKPIVNMGVSGNTTAMGLERIDSVITENPGTVILLLGGNDYLRKVPDAETFNNLRTIISRLQKEGIFVILLGIRGGLLIDRFDGLFADLAKEMNVPYVPNVLEGLLGNDQYMSDAIHPNDAGYVRMTDRVYGEIKDFF